jgi:hypothetical protein
LSAEFRSVTGTGDDIINSRRIMPHALVALEHSRPLHIANSVYASLLGRTGNWLSAKNEPNDANRYLAEAYKLLAGKPTEVALFARTCEAYGRVSYATGELERARSLIIEAMPLFSAEGDRGKQHYMQIHIDLA